MCRYGFKNYKLTYACFKCQIGFKRPDLFDVQPELAGAMQKKQSKRVQQCRQMQKMQNAQTVAG
jgi:hypothetical protein